MTDDEFAERDGALRHSIQSGVKWEMEQQTVFQTMPETIKSEFKHLRVGLNCAMAEHAGIVKMLIDKGVVSEQEYRVTALWALEKELTRLEQAVNRLYGTDRIKFR